MGVSAIILAAGAGTRMKSKKPKVVHGLLDKPLVRWVVDAAYAAGAQDVACVVGHGREQVIPLIEHDTAVIVQERLIGTADAVASCAEAFQGHTGSLLVLSGDSPLITPATLRSLVAQREREQAAACVLTMDLSDPFGYGRILRDQEGALLGIVEQKDCTPEQAQITECNSGFYCFDAQALFKALEEVGNDNAQGEYYLTDVLAIFRKEGRGVCALQTAQPQECLGVNSRSQLAQATRQMQRSINERHLAAGVTMTDPALVWIGPDVVLANDVELLPLTFLYGKTEIGEDSIVGPNSRLTDAVVGSGCVIEESIVAASRIDDGATCGPRAYIRPGTHLCRNAKAGTHVEIKNSEIGARSKVPHLSYIGDAVVGADVNIGAGSITCNYDGTHKHQTIIGDGAFIGSDTMLVAPVRIGSHAFTGAASAITQDVPDRALAVERAPQKLIAEWEAFKHAKEAEKQGAQQEA
ncbi:MAG: bifunctional UDP-N-acetylglucosamine diphosphorylase/glucosamine-1-phosphate N-acetyltransferase GlmU [Coriobacteriaceae bacterium]|jgi:bifunctional UDP-N-acetylglucosamine pyrophosphorylase/glucosamine-1-phosphate N-acetyltransferase|nr:bifunctional UDP-N-acetylglucosamine diphosphorylase/glucosamine-1-phosphate N-acetyltransferase GlmU [Coriobacteriaceae bacterium]